MVGLIKNFTESIIFALDNAIYNYPWKNTGLGKYMPTEYNIFPYDLFIIIAKLLKGNCVCFFFLMRTHHFQLYMVEMEF